MPFPGVGNFAYAGVLGRLSGLSFIPVWNVGLHPLRLPVVAAADTLSAPAGSPRPGYGMAVAACAFLLRYAQFLDRLLLDCVERVSLIPDPREVDFLQVDAADRVVVRRFVVESAVRQIDRRGPLRRARCSIPIGMSKLFRIWKLCNTASSPVPHAGAVAL